jgi:hypothetical protein
VAVAGYSAIWYTLTVRFVMAVLLALALGQATAVPSARALEVCAASCSDDDASGRCAPSCVDCTCCGHAVNPFVACAVAAHAAAFSARRVAPDVASRAPRLDGHDVFHVPRTSLA